ncbi:MULTISPECIES: NAD-dependent epimerase/dehydratase family protein [unclassified Bradyrhizobium]|uniref:NAD-dependent epimerase/dehydratase family protein n=1 Tax=unclassified Bradyrhizobium TaxID=2631580 RepID=UPI002479E406|nr:MULTISPECIES: NAD-dependent epimerase/dehydratase family protein [unclassified Bradyrhizobium]WGS19156.1 NAD-dependent epimerase/dehydratase family protein [Bradyrhizobium sp. ISRA463]WGS25993.1 NAD-dependent epimerase/dehydratase family protein [Bradyrhizobium sp. ISRA464]
MYPSAFRDSFSTPGRNEGHTVALATARAGNVIGGGDWAQDRLIPDILRALSVGEVAKIGSPTAVRPWQHVLEPLSGYLALAERLFTDGLAFADASWADQSDNLYVASKVRLGDFIEDFSARWGRVIHIRMHTLYGGGPPSGHIFLGQMRDAIARKAQFEISHGTQLREYHHVADDVSAIIHLLQSDINGAFDLNHGQPIRLCDCHSYLCSLRLP